MALSTSCPGCNAVLRIEESYVGRRVRCSKCKKSFVLSSVSFQKTTTTDEAALTVSTETIAPSATAAGSLPRDGNASRGSAPRPPGRKFGRFELLDLLGQGAYGQVHKAHDPLLDRHVALKIPKFRSDQRQLVERFLREAKAAARLRHPNIVAVFESGQVDDSYYIAAEFVDGETASARMEREPPSLRQSAQWCRELAGALAYAHANGVVHRDIKPGNILIDRTGRPQITDFGLATLVEEQGDGASEGGVSGTPAYMSPEQARGETFRIGPASDQYSLGAMLYELLTGRRPFSGPSHLVIAKAAGEELPDPPRKIRPEIPRDLEAVCLKSMDKDFERRYPDAQAFADDLQSWLEDRPVRVRRIGGRERLVRWSRRNPVLAASVATTFALVLAIVGGVFTRVVRERVQAERRADVAESELESLESKSTLSEAALRQSARGRSLVAEGTTRFDAGDWHGALPFFAAALRVGADDPEREALHRCRVNSALDAGPQLLRQWDREGSVDSIAISPEGRFVAATSAAESQANSVTVWRTGDGRPAYEPMRHTAAVRHVVFGPVGEAILSSGADSTARLWMSGTGQPLCEPLRHDGPVNRGAFSPDGTRVVTASDDGTARCWNAATGKSLFEPMRHDRPVKFATFSGDGRWILTACETPFMPGPMVGHVAVWDAATGRQRHRFPDGSFQHMGAISSDGKLTAARLNSAGVQVLDLESLQPTTPLLAHENTLFGLAMQPGGTALATCGEDRTIRIWNSTGGKPIGAPLRRDSAVQKVFFSNDGRLLVAVSDNDVAVWNTTTWELATSPVRQTDKLTDASLSVDGRLLVTAGQDGLIRLWKLPQGLPESWRPFGLPGTEKVPILFSSDGRRLASIGHDQTLRIYEWPSGVLAHRPISWGLNFDYGGFSPDGRLFALGSSNADVKVFDVTAGGVQIAQIPPGGYISLLEFSPDGGRVAIGTWEGKLQIWDLARAAAVPGEFQHGRTLRSLSFDPTGRWIATASDQGFRMLDAETGADRYPPLALGKFYMNVAFSPDGTKWLGGVEIGGQGAAYLLDAATGQQLAPPFRHPYKVRHVAWSPDGSAFATGDERGAARLWNGSTGTPISDVLLHPDNFITFGFSEGGRRFIGNSSHGPFSFRLWDGHTGAPLFPATIPNVVTQYGLLSPDGTTILGSTGEAAFVIDLVRKSQSIEDLTRRADLISARRIDESGASVAADRATMVSGWNELERHAAGAGNPALLVAPFGPDEISTARKAWSARLGTEERVTGPDGMQFVLIPPGEFRMGSALSRERILNDYPKTTVGLIAGEWPQHRVRITRPFYMAVHEVTRGQFRRFADETGYKTEAEHEGKQVWGWVGQDFAVRPNTSWREWGVEQDDTMPVVFLCWYDAMSYCAWLSHKEGKTYRLPTEAEWEYACRAGTVTRFPHGKDEGGLNRIGNLADVSAKDKVPWWDATLTEPDGYAFLAPVGKFAPNPFGLHDTIGNAAEWCADWFDENYYAKSPESDPPGPSAGTERVMRGGAWDRKAGYCRSATRMKAASDFPWGTGGIRLVLETTEAP